MSSTHMTREAVRLAVGGHLVEASDLLLNAARAAADESGYSTFVCGCGRFVANNELPCFHALGECAVCAVERRPTPT